MEIISILIPSLGVQTPSGRIRPKRRCVTSNGMEAKDCPVSETRAERAARPAGAPLSLSKQVGLLLKVNAMHGLTTWQYRRLQSLTKQLNPEGLIAAKNFAERLRPEVFRSLQPWVIWLSRPRRGPAEYHKPEKRRIGVGYTDKGTLPAPSTRERKDAIKLAWLFGEDFPGGWWLGLGMLPLYLRGEQEGDWFILSQALYES
jgi:hypothetical protein